MDAIPHSQPDAAHPDAGADGKPPVKRSWRRKYRKMRARFEDTMSTSNQLVTDEWRGQALSRRLREQNDQILELLLSMNDTARLPAPLRYDVRSLAEIEAADPLLPADPDPEIVQQKMHELRADLTSGAITEDEYARRAERLHNAQPVQPLRSLASLEAKVPHTTHAPEPPIDGIDLTETAPGYMTPAHEEEYLLAIDMALADPSYNPHAHDGRPLRMVPAQPPPSEKDLTVRNPSSVYNWLRKNQPQVFLQDKDPQHPENVSEKSAARTGGASRKRQSAAHGTPGPKTDHEEEEGAVQETGKSRKSKGGEDDGAYRPKGGSSRPANKRKREETDPATKGSRKKNRASAGTAG
ncbi:hypothetical protein P280DRAFT_467868 [Massarina eburnea CBS 473.64]|uniref:IEC3 subunit of the Ino80 complex, chromatin re-modelling-domain-containing protein n=1 Tax=Massarina eburnea CBS 473.64 TaxID=1395130 RepID=A0A6A6S3P5_9PLEO|nr:hypothetical protein P280DRAFT_467868 [Massarina eburnea CBS 473.64]